MSKSTVNYQVLYQITLKAVIEALAELDQSNIGLTRDILQSVLRTNKNLELSADIST